MFGNGNTKSVISNEEMNDIMKIIRSFEEVGVLIKGTSETIKNKAKERKGEFLRMLSRTLGASLLWNLLTGKGVVRAGEGTVRAGEKIWEERGSEYYNRSIKSFLQKSK